MKINSPNNINSKIDVTPSNKINSDNKAGEEFNAIFERELLKSSGKVDPGLGKDMPKGQGVTPVSSSSTAIMEINSLRQGSLKKVNTLLINLEIYQNSLANPAINLHRMEGLIKEMTLIGEEAIKSASYLPDDDPLKNIVSETVLTVLRESRQYYNGYN